MLLIFWLISIKLCCWWCCWLTCCGLIKQGCCSWTRWWIGDVGQGVVSLLSCYSWSGCCYQSSCCCPLLSQAGRAVASVVGASLLIYGKWQPEFRFFMFRRTDVKQWYNFFDKVFRFTLVRQPLLLFLQPNLAHPEACTAFLFIIQSLFLILSA